jgi:hypothetical protein
MDIKEIFTDATAEQVKAFKDLLGKEFVPNDQYSKIKDKLTAKEEQEIALNKQLTENNVLLKDLKAKAELTDEYKTKLDKASADFELLKVEGEQRLTGVQKVSALEKALRKSKASDDAVDLLIKDFKLEEIALDEKGEIKDCDKLIGAVKEKRPNLFIKTIADGGKPPDGKETDPTNDDSKLRRVMGLPPK